MMSDVIDCFTLEDYLEEEKRRIIARFKENPSAVLYSRPLPILSKNDHEFPLVNIARPKDI